MLKNKNHIYLLGLLLAIICSYYFSFSKTIETKRQLTSLRSEVLGFENLANLSYNLKNKEHFLDSVLVKNNLKNTSVQNSLLDFLNEESSKTSVKIVAFEKPHSNVNDGVNLISYQFTLTGSYEKIEQIIYKIEQETGYGNVSHVSFEKKRDYRKRKTFLYANVIIENYDSQ